MLEIHGISAHYGGVRALDDVSFKLDEKEILALIGGNGAGKTTLLNLISGIIKPSKGNIIFKGKSILSLSPDKIVGLGIIQVPEGRAVFPELTVAENLRMGSFTRRDDNAVISDMGLVFDLFPRLKERRKQNAGTLSGGEAQMLAVARGLLSAPRLLMLDEPSLGIAPVIRDNIFRVIQQVFDERGITILLVEQNAKLALNMSSRGYILENGKVSLEGKGSELIDNDYVKRAYLGY